MKKKHPEHVNHERWLVSYADFITLLFAFFVVLFASGQTSQRKTMEIAHSMQAAFAYNGIFEQHSRTPPITDDGNSIEHAVTSPLALPLPARLQPSMTKISAARIEQTIAAQVAHRGLRIDSITVHASPDGLVVSLSEAGFFDSGSANLRDETLSSLKALAAALPVQPMRVEGHTDNVPIHTAQFATNWELSTARAAAITRLLISEKAAAPESISAAGYAEFHPVADNGTEAGRAQNRRVDIVLLSAPASPQPQAPSQ